MAVATSYWDGCMKSEMLKMKRCRDATAEGLYTTFKRQLEKCGIPTRQLVGFAGDTCNVMWGAHNSVVQKLKEDIPTIVAVKCACHISHLCSSKAFSKLPLVLEDFLRSIPSVFSTSPKNKDSFEQFQEFCQTAKHQMLKPAFTRWLTLQPCAARVLEQFHPLTLFFIDLVSEKPTDSHTKILNLLRDPITKYYLQFLVKVLDKFNKFNATFQSDKPLLHELQPYIHNLILDLCRCYMDNNYVNSYKSFPLQIDPEEESKFKPLRNIYIGKSIITFIKSNTLYLVF